MKDIQAKCFRTACDRPAHPCGWNAVTHGLYCLQCAETIGKNNLANIPLTTLFPLLQFYVHALPQGRHAEAIVYVKERTVYGKENSNG